MKHMTVAVILAVGSAGAVWAQAPIHGAASLNSGHVSQADNRDGGPNEPGQVKSIGQILHDNPQLEQKLTALLPEGTTPEQACAGYKVLEQCVSAVHLAADLKIKFADLKAATTGKHAAGLEKAAQQLAPGSDARAAVKKARSEAAQDMKGVSLFGV